MILRSAVEQDAESLTRIAREAKASWGYPEAWLTEWAALLRFTPGDLRDRPVFVAELEGQPVGVIALEAEPEPGIGHLWVLPTHQGRGIGAALLAHGIDFARSQSWTELRIEADPGARPFYERMGAVVVGQVAAPVGGQERFLPLMRLPVG